MLDLVEVGGGHHDSAVNALIEGVRRGKDDMLLATAFGREGDVGDLLVLAIHLAVIVVDDVDFDGLAVDVVLAGLGELGFAFSELGYDLAGRDAGGRGGIELAEAGGVLRGGEMRRRRKSEGEQCGFGGQFHRCGTPSFGWRRKRLLINVRR